MKELTYSNVKGLMIPNLDLPSSGKPIGKYGRMRRSYLKRSRKTLYSRMMIRGTLAEHLRQIDETAREQITQLTAQMAKAEGTDEAMKAADPMRWTGLMNNYRHSAEETVIRTIVFS